MISEAQFIVFVNNSSIELLQEPEDEIVSLEFQWISASVNIPAVGKRQIPTPVSEEQAHALVNWIESLIKNLKEDYLIFNGVIMNKTEVEEINWNEFN